MPTPTYDLIASSVLGSSVASVTFSSISSSYRDLVLVVNSQVSTSSGIQVKFNGDTGANYNYLVMAGTGSSVEWDSGANQTIGVLTNYVNAQSTRETLFITHIFDYSVTDKHKTYLTRGNDGGGSGVSAFTGRWATTSAITSIELYLPSTRTFSAGGTFYLYGIVS